MNVVLWIIQVLLAALFLFAGGMKLVLPLDQLAGPAAMPQFPLWFLRFIGMCEVLGALGLILPGIFRVRKGLTPLAACGLVLIMVGAILVTLTGGLFLPALISLVVGLLAAFVGYNRWKFG